MEKFNNGYLQFTEIDSKSLLSDKLLKCQKGSIHSGGYEEKRHYLIEYFNELKSECYGIGINCQQKMDFNNIETVETEGLLIIYYDNVLEVYQVSSKLINKIFEYRVNSYIYDVGFKFNRIAIIYEIGVLIVDLKTKKIVKEVLTDVIRNFSINDHDIHIEDDKKTYSLKF